MVVGPQLLFEEASWVVPEAASDAQVAASLVHCQLLGGLHEFVHR